MDEASRPVVVKVGGSLLDLADLGSRIEGVLAQWPGRRVALLCGGGALVDVIREWQGPLGLSDGACHELAMRGLDVTAGLLSQVLPGSTVCESCDDLEVAWGRSRCGIIVPRGWFEAHPENEFWSRSWEMTSDSLAALVALQLDADLVLAKSTDLQFPGDWITAARKGLVDEWMARIAPCLRSIGWVNLRRSPVRSGKPPGFELSAELAGEALRRSAARSSSTLS